jgi:hypothetical protein
MEMIIEGDKKATLVDIHQFDTYRNLLCGLPTIEINKGIKEGLKQLAKHFTFIEAFYLIEPQEQVINLPYKYEFGTPARLPEVTCLIKLEIEMKALTIAWFQEDFVFPPSIEILEKIKKIPWTEVCGDSDWG